MMNFTSKFEAPKSLVEHIKDYMMEAIIQGKLRSGQQLVEMELKNYLNVSRTPLREAFRILEREGFLQRIPRRGMFVRKVTKKDIEENLLVRAYLEGLAAKLAVPNMNSHELAAMEEMVANMRRVAEAENFNSYVEYHDMFHRIFIQASRCNLLIEILMNLRKHAFWHHLNFLHFREAYRDASDVHQQILELFRSKKQKEVEGLVRKHIYLARENFLRFTPEEGEEKEGSKDVQG